MAAYIKRRLELMGEKVMDSMSVCKDFVEKIGQGHSLTESDQKEIKKLKVSMGRLMKEIQNYTHQYKGAPSEDMENLIEELTAVHMKADDMFIDLGIDMHTDMFSTGQHEPASSESLASVSTNITSRLPKLDLPRFDGRVLTWHEFWSKFTASVDGRTGLKDVDKLAYLQIATADGSAKDLIAGLATTDDNYKIAVDTLMEEYGEKGIIIDAHYTALFEVPRASQELPDNKRVLAEIDRHLRILDALGENTGQNNALRAMIIVKFSADVQSNLRMKLKPTQENVTNIMRALKTIIKALEHHSAPNATQSCPSGPNFTTEALYAHATSSGNGQNAKPNEQHSKPNWNQKRKSRYELQANKRAKSDNRFQKNTPTSNPKGDQRNSAKGPDKSSNDSGGRDNHKRTQRPLRCLFCQGSHTHESCRRHKTIKDRKAQLAGRCFICLREHHSASGCPTASTFCTHCGKRGHNRCLCPTKYGSEETLTTFSQTGCDTILQTALAPIQFGRDQVVKAKVLFDCGSQKSYIHSSLAKQLRLTPLEKTSLTVFTFGSTKPKTIPADLVTVCIRLQGSMVELMAYVVPSTTGLLPSHHEFKSNLRTELPHVDWAEDSKEDRYADIIVGNDFYYKFIMVDRQKINDNLYLIKTGFGWIPSGSFDRNEGGIEHQLSVLTYVEGGCVRGNGCMCDLFIRPDPAIRNDEVKMLWELEAIGITDPPKVIQEEDVIEYFNKTVQFLENRYYVKWPWVEYPPNITPNFGLALGRLQSLLKRLDEDQRQRYNDVLKDQFQKGIIEEIPDDMLNKSYPIHYLPHHCVIQEHKSTKLRIVYDASSKIKGQCSLNELLYKGPLMLEDLTTMLLRFRTHPIAIVADIEKAFLQIGLQTQDRDVTRFLWIRDVNRAPSDDNLIHLRFCRVPFGIISSPFLLAATIRHHILSKDNAYANKLASCLYVDNLVTGVQTTFEAKELYGTAVRALNEISMNLRDWNSNDKEFLNALPESHKDKSNVISVLGLTWDTVNDVLRLAFLGSKLEKPAKSKREVLRIIASVFDPCGFVAPLTLPTRIFLQHLWKKGLQWDTPLSHEQIQTWNSCVKYLKEVPRFITTRRYVTSTGLTYAPLELHCFTDASQDAYVAVVYVRTEHEVGYVISKSRVTPLRRKAHLTIPKLELLAVVIGTRLLSYVRQALGLQSTTTYLWTDNQAVLGWLQSQRLLPPWISRRVGEIRRAPNIIFRYVPSALNPADVATRPIQNEGIPDCWLEGPDFLRKPISHWPAQQLHIDDNHTGSEEAQLGTRKHSSPLDTTHILLNTTVPPGEWELPSHGATLPLPAVLHMQSIHFKDEVSNKSTQLSKTLGIFKDEHGVLRCKGRYQNAALPYEQRCPILLPKEADLTSWVIQRVHVENYHVGVSHTLSLLRHHYWIPRGRSIVSKTLKHCPECVKYGGGPFRLPDMPDLPRERLSYSPPFTYTGLDYLGPLVVTEKGTSRKRWVCLFTCMAVRAIHMEIVQDLSAAEFILCLRRFVASRGAPKLLLSDNASQFKLASAVLASPVAQANDIDWRFTTELSPWQGGLYERLVGLVKHCLIRTVDKTLLNDSQLTTIMKEIEAVLNTRPLTTVGPENEVILTPSHFLRTCGPPGLHTPGTDPPCFPTVTQQHVVQGWKHTVTLLDEFQKMFTNQYLLSLRERHTPTHKQPRVLSYREPAVGDIVQVKGDTRNRAHWRVGKITEFASSVDGHVRSARVALENGVVVTRSIGHLYPLEMDLDHSEEPVMLRPGAPTPLDNTPDRGLPAPALPTAPVSQVSPSPPLAERPRRAAAQQARQRIRQWTANLFTLAYSSLRSPSAPARL